MMNEPAPNPYVGPTPYARNDWRGFYGREDDLRRLAILFLARRIVLLYSPSGAGKTSLVQAGLIPILEEEGFTVLPTVRLKQELPDSTTDGNRFVYSTILSLETIGDNGDGLTSAQGLEDRSELANGVAASAQQNLAAYWGARREALGVQPVVLFFDQFEEVLTLDAHDHDTKVTFFDQLGEMLALDGQTWALFAIREDYLAELDPYRHLIPGKYGDAYRLELLNEQQALAAIQNPARDVGVTFPGEVADKLVEELRCTQVKQRDGSVVLRTGRYVEPVQIQIVCDTLWQDRQPQKGDVIEPHWFGAADHVDKALGDFYDRKVAQIAAMHNVDQRDVRHFFDRDLITEDGLRGQVMNSDEMALSAAVIGDLVDAHLVRAEERRGIQWYELAHDRLVRPIHEHNETWYRENLSLLQLRAEAWQRAPHKELLLQGAQWQEAERWARGRKLKSYEEAFLAASRAREQAQRWKRIFAAAILVLISVLVVGMFSLWREAEGERVTAEMLATRANDNYELARVNEAAALRNADLAATREAEAREAEDAANVARAQAESLRLADRAEVFLERRNLPAALLAGRRAILVAETEAAQDVLRQAIENAADEPAPDDMSTWQALACELAGRNMTLTEWQDTFATAEYETICPQYGFDLSYVEEALMVCSSTAEARRRYATAEQAVADGRVLDFDEWALPLLLERAVSEEEEWRARDCLRTAQETRFEFSLYQFMQLKERLGGLADTFESDVINDQLAEDPQILQEVEELDAWRQPWQPVVAAAFDRQFSNYYRLLCVNLGALEPAKRSCSALNRIIERNPTLAGSVPITRTAATSARSEEPGRRQSYTFQGDYGDIVTIDVPVDGQDLKPTVTLRNSTTALAGGQTGTAGPVSEVLLPATDRYFIDLAWPQMPPFHSLMVTRTQLATIFVGDTARVEDQLGARLWRAEGNAGDVIAIHMEALNRGDPVLRVLDAQGALVAENDDFGGTRNSHITVSLPDSGVYFVEAGWFEEGFASSYQLAVSRVEQLIAGDVAAGMPEQRDWMFEGTRGEYVSVAAVSPDERSAPLLAITSEEGQIIAQDDDGIGSVATLDAVRLPGTGRFFVNLNWAGEPVDFELSLNRVEPEQLAWAQTELDVSADRQLWAFSGEGGEVVTIAVEASDEQGRPLLWLSDEAGGLLAADESGDERSALICGFQLPHDGRYLIATGWQAEPGEYAITLSQGEPALLQLGGSVQGDGPDACLWQFSGQRGDYVTAAMTAHSAEGDPSLTLLDQTGQLLVYDEGDNDRDARVGLVLPADGDYRLRTGWFGAPGSYSLTLANDQPETVGVGVARDSLSPEQSGWQIEAAQGDLLTVSVQAEDGTGSPFLTLYDRSGTVVEVSDRGTLDAEAQMRVIVPEDGSYIIHTGWIDSPVTYTLSVEAQVPQFLSLPEAEVESEPEQWMWQLEGTAGTYLTIAMEALEEDGDPLLRLYDANGRFLEENDDFGGTNSRLSFLLPQSGTYFVEAGWFSNPGRYRLSVQQADSEVDLASMAMVSREGALALLERGSVLEGLALLEQVALVERTTQMSLLSAADYNWACWHGSLWGYAVEALNTCELAVALEPENGGYIDSRGVARALTGDFEGAIEDFLAFLAWGYGGNDEWRRERESWIEALQAGRNPFDDPELLEHLRINE